MEESILSGIEKGFKTMCFTEHMDYDYPDSPDGPGSIFIVNTDSYLYDLLRLKDKYADKIRILFGIELGLQATQEVFRKNAVYARSYEFDFIIGSSHVCNGKDPYYPAFYEGRSEEEAYREYFTSIYDNIKKFDNFDVYGHLDYVVRYGPNRDTNYSYEQYKDILDKILELLIDKGKGIEINTGGYDKGLKDFHPCKAILKRYHELGGEIITCGSDSHDAIHVGNHFDMAAEVLKECGFKYYTVFEKRVAEFVKL